MPTFEALLRAVQGGVRNKVKLSREDEQRKFCRSGDDSRCSKNCQWEIFLILQIVCKILGQRLLKTSQLPDLNIRGVRFIS